MKVTEIKISTDELKRCIHALIKESVKWDAPGLNNIDAIQPIDKTGVLNLDLIKCQEFLIILKYD